MHLFIVGEIPVLFCTIYYLKLPCSQAKKTGPEFSTLYRNIEKNIQVNFSAVEILLHQRAILDLMELANSLVPPSTDDSQQSKNLSDDKAEAGSSLELWKEKEKGDKLLAGRNELHY